MVRRSSPRGGCVMSPSMRSKPVSKTSSGSGRSGLSEATSVSDVVDATDDAPDDASAPAATSPAGESPQKAPAEPEVRAAGAAAATRPGRTVRIELEASRQRSIGWMIFDLIVGVLLIRGLGTVGVWVG